MASVSQIPNFVQQFIIFTEILAVGIDLFCQMAVDHGAGRSDESVPKIIEDTQPHIRAICCCSNGDALKLSASSRTIDHLGIVGQSLAIATKLCFCAPTGRNATSKLECSAWVDWPDIKKEANEMKPIRYGLLKVPASLPHCGLSAPRPL
ncbi:hypothetical protein [Sinorhizobium fredii]|uniref:hypothetical protein n=1 Tax=Rhizobium fredii TaxID=380 RepID=UPI0011D23B1E|nr:hypothetical protein [Sinorhizobium fredii]WOS65578.1 hypothetical protein SFGR64A_29390 [Sinorhizobium fredii GR64]